MKSYKKEPGIILEKLEKRGGEWSGIGKKNKAPWC